MNIVLGEAYEEVKGSESNLIGMVVSKCPQSALFCHPSYSAIILSTSFYVQVIRGNSILQFELMK